MCNECEDLNSRS